jgi:hypothetical protein
MPVEADDLPTAEADILAPAEADDRAGAPPTIAAEIDAADPPTAPAAAVAASEPPPSPPAAQPTPPAAPADVPVSAALAAALAPIPPRRGGHQQPRPPVVSTTAAQAPAPEGATAAPPPRRRVKLISIFWAIALLFVIASGLLVATWSATGPHLSPDLAILARMPGGRIITLRGMGAPNANARLYLVDNGRRAELAVDSMPALPGGRVYQAWVAEAGQPVRGAGSFYVSRKGDAIVPAAVNIPAERIQAIFITQEPAPGTNAPSGPRLLQWAP